MAGPGEWLRLDCATNYLLQNDTSSEIEETISTQTGLVDAPLIAELTPSSTINDPYEELSVLIIELTDKSLTSFCNQF